MANNIFRALKARKAKYGFTAYLSTRNFILIADAVKRAKELDPELLFEMPTSGGSVEVKLYTESEQAAHSLGFACYPD